MTTPASPALDAQKAADPTGSADSSRRPGLIEAMNIARRSVAMFTELPVDAVSSCEQRDGGWRVVVDVIESAARMGDNDLLAQFEVLLGETGEVAAFNRIARYKREEQSGAGS